MLDFILHAQVTLIKKLKKKKKPDSPLPVWLSYFSFSDCGVIESHISSGLMISNSRCRWLMNSQPEFIKEISQQLHVKQHLFPSRGSGPVTFHWSHNPVLLPCPRKHGSFISDGTLTGRQPGLGH